MSVLGWSRISAVVTASDFFIVFGSFNPLPFWLMARDLFQRERKMEFGLKSKRISARLSVCFRSPTSEDLAAQEPPFGELTSGRRFFKWDLEAGFFISYLMNETSFFSFSSSSSFLSSRSHNFLRDPIPFLLQSLTFSSSISLHSSNGSLKTESPSTPRGLWQIFFLAGPLAPDNFASGSLSLPDSWEILRLQGPSQIFG